MLGPVYLLLLLYNETCVRFDAPEVDGWRLGVVCGVGAWWRWQPGQRIIVETAETEITPVCHQCCGKSLLLKGVPDMPSGSYYVGRFS